MYKKDKWIIILIFILVSLISYFITFDLKQISGEAITIISIALAVYTASFSGLISSPLLRLMRRKQDVILMNKTQLGVLESYLRFSINIGLICIIMCCLIKLFPNYNIDGNTSYIYSYRVFSAIGIGVLSINIYCIWLLSRFMINRQLRN